ncbi:MAG: hypothetical protein KA782_07310 [Flavobacterium sp.]|nr:hypothetical protein [Flavobacterium sp.]MBP6587210.1 hypothetical protein [Flavobacterium sp.]MBP7470879.1 hypothetical protein [Flavobacterium sp.]
MSKLGNPVWPILMEKDRLFGKMRSYPKIMDLLPKIIGFVILNRIVFLNSFSVLPELFDD